MKPDRFESLQERLGIRFKRIGLLKQAFTHTSYVNEHKSASAQDNERLEFLGDCFHKMATSISLFAKS